MVILQTRLLAILHLFLGCEEVGFTMPQTHGAPMLKNSKGRRNSVVRHMERPAKELE